MFARILERKTVFMKFTEHLEKGTNLDWAEQTRMTGMHGCS